MSFPLPSVGLERAISFSCQFPAAKFRNSPLAPRHQHGPACIEKHAWYGHMMSHECFWNCLLLQYKKISTKWRSWTITKHPNKHVQTRSNFRLDKPSLSSLLKHCSANWSASRCFLPGWPSVKTYPKWNTEDNALLMTSKFESIV